MNEYKIRQIIREEIGKFMSRDFQDDVIPINPEENLGITSIDGNGY